jgi:Plavaka transposase
MLDDHKIRALAAREHHRNMQAEQSDIEMHGALSEPPRHNELPPLPAPVQTVPELTQAGRPARRYRLPRRYEDIPPEGPAPIPDSDVPAVHATPIIPRVILHVRDLMRTGLNRFGLLREYPHRPSYDPDSSVPPEELADYAHPEPILPKHNNQLPPPWPFKNMSTYLILEWMGTGSTQKSVGEVDRLVKEVIRHEEFNVEDLAGFSVRRGNKTLDMSDHDGTSTPFSGDAWIESKVDISIPSGMKDVEPKTYSVAGLHRRPLVPVMKAALTDVTARRFHFSPFKRIWFSPTGAEIRCFDEAYTSDAFLEAHDKLQKQRNEPGCTYEKVVLGLMFWSDSTHLANFGTAKVWPVYLYFANLSKYIRCKPNSAASHHIAYIPSVSIKSTFHLNGMFIYLVSCRTVYRMTYQPGVSNQPSSPIADANLCTRFGANCLMTIL